jgi:hypothetical protein
MNAKSTQFINNLSPEAQQAIKSIAETIRPALDEIHSHPATTQNYYSDYMRILSYKPKQVKLLAIAMIYAGANPAGIEAAIKYV